MHDDPARLEALVVNIAAATGTTPERVWDAVLASRWPPELTLLGLACQPIVEALKQAAAAIVAWYDEYWPILEQQETERPQPQRFPSWDRRAGWCKGKYRR